MRILVTGATGDVGPEVVRRLAALGHSVRVLGRRTGLSVQDAEYVSCDITDFQLLHDVMRGSDRVVHLAALRSPFEGASEEIFRVNCDGSFNVYHAAARHGIRRVVSASSINALGFHYGVKSFPIRYLPVDEEHPAFTTDPYSFSKQVLEDIAAYFWRREGISGACLRFPMVFNASPAFLHSMRAHLSSSRKTLRDWTSLAPAEAAAQVSTIVEAKESMRAARVEEHPADWRAVYRGPHMDIVGSYSNLFTQLDARDAAQAVEKALFGSYDGSHPLYINDSLNRHLLDSKSLARLFYPQAEVRQNLEGSAALVSIDRARALLGFEPEYTVAALGLVESD